jgi:hypothetical protein
MKTTAVLVGVLLIVGLLRIVNRIRRAASDMIYCEDFLRHARDYSQSNGRDAEAFAYLITHSEGMQRRLRASFWVTRPYSGERVTMAVGDIVSEMQRLFDLGITTAAQGYSDLLVNGVARVWGQWDEERLGDRSLLLNPLSIVALARYKYDCEPDRSRSIRAGS